MEAMKLVTISETAIVMLASVTGPSGEEFNSEICMQLQVLEGLPRASAGTMKKLSNSRNSRSAP